MCSKKKITPFLKQYLDIKKKYKDCLLFYRMGDFYELFFEDAKIVSKELGIILTAKGKHQDNNIPMSGVPIHSYEHRVSKLVKSGFKVAICEQVESADQAKKRGSGSIIYRKVVKIFTKGTISIQDNIDGRYNNYVMSVYKDKNFNWFLAWIDITTRDFKCIVCKKNDVISYIKNINPSEILISESLYQSIFDIVNNKKIIINNHADNVFEYNRNNKIISDYYKIKDINHLGFTHEGMVVVCGVIVDYIMYINAGELDLNTINKPNIDNHASYLYLDKSVIESLEIFKDFNNKSSNSLCNILDKTLTNGGSRLFKKILSFPLISVEEINKRLDLVEFFIKDNILMFDLMKILTIFPDMERSVNRICMGNKNPNDLLIIKKSLYLSLRIHKKIFNQNNYFLKEIFQYLHDKEEIYDFLDKAIVDKEFKKDYRGCIKLSFNAKLRELHELKSESNNIIAKLVEKYRYIFSIPQLKISSNNLIGYFIEIPNNITITNDILIHKQSLSSVNRYVTSELIELENKIINADNTYAYIEKECLDEICKKILQNLNYLFEMSKNISLLDVLLSFAELSTNYNYVRPILDNSRDFIIKNGRHAVLAPKDHFIPNDFILDDKTRMYLLTGPNMAGKSTFLRQNAIIAILAHIGCFVPSEYAKIGVIDKMFSRVGSADKLFEGKSTFMVEMEETASIVHQATDKSFVILDEIGRGTSLKDGIAIAGAVIEYLHDKNCCRTIFATHYHDLSVLCEKLQRIQNYFVKVDVVNDSIIFKYDVQPGVSYQSYGINIAKIAGLPDEITCRALSLISE